MERIALIVGVFGAVVEHRPRRHVGDERKLDPRDLASVGPTRSGIEIDEELGIAQKRPVGGEVGQTA